MNGNMHKSDAVQKRGSFHGFFKFHKRREFAFDKMEDDDDITELNKIQCEIQNCICNICQFKRRPIHFCRRGVHRTVAEMNSSDSDIYEDAHSFLTSSFVGEDSPGMDKLKNQQWLPPRVLLDFLLDFIIHTEAIQDYQSLIRDLTSRIVELKVILISNIHF